MTAQAFRICRARASAFLDCALAVVQCAFSDLMVTFRGRRKANLGFFVAKSTLRGRCRASECFYFDVQIWEQAQRVGHGECLGL